MINGVKQRSGSNVGHETIEIEMDVIGLPPTFVS